MLLTDRHSRTTAVGYRVRFSPEERDGALAPAYYMYNGVTYTCNARDFAFGYMTDEFAFHNVFLSPLVETSFPALFGWPEEPSTRVLRGSKVANAKYDDVRDGGRYGGLWSAVPRLDRASQQEFTGESECSHSTIGGASFIGGNGTRRFTLGGLFGHQLVSAGVPEIPGWRGLEGQNGIRPQRDDNGRLWFAPAQTGVRHNSMPDFVEFGEFVGHFVRHVGTSTASLAPYHGSEIHREYSNFHIQAVDDRTPGALFVQLGYRYHVGYYSRMTRAPIFTQTYEVSFSMGTSVSEAQILYPYGWEGLIELEHCGHASAHQEYKLVDFYIAPGFEVSEASHAYWPLEQACPRDPSETASVPDIMWDRSKLADPASVSSVYSWVRHNRKQLDEFARTHIRELRQTALYAAGDAIEGWAKSDANMWETIPELPEALSLLDASCEAALDIAKVIKGDFAGIPKLAKSLSSAYLSWKYGILPSTQDVAFLSRMVKREIDSFGTRTSVLYGKFVYDFPPDIYPSDGQLRLTTRTKITLSGLTQVAALLTAFRTSGVGTTLENAWDLVPFSFVIDWFTNLGDRFGDIDNSVLLTVLRPAYYVHTYTLVYQPSESENRRAGLSSDSYPRYKVFLREVSRRNPYPMPDLKIDFRQPTHSRWVVPAGALLCVMS